MRTLNSVPHSRLTHQLQARDITFTIDPSSINFFETRHGMAATAKIVLNGTHPSARSPISQNKSSQTLSLLWT
jgi:hypothetical protein